MNEFAQDLQQYLVWCQNEGKKKYGEESKSWGNPWEEPFIIEGTKAKLEDIKLLEDQFGKLPKSYTEAITNIGYVGFRSGCYGLLRVLGHSEITKFFEVVQCELDDDLREPPHLA